jgi:hypothetical protein
VFGFWWVFGFDVSVCIWDDKGNEKSEVHITKTLRDHSFQWYLQWFNIFMVVEVAFDR